MFNKCNMCGNERPDEEGSSIPIDGEMKWFCRDCYNSNSRQMLVRAVE